MGFAIILIGAISFLCLPVCEYPNINARVGPVAYNLLAREVRHNAE